MGATSTEGAGGSAVTLRVLRREERRRQQPDPGAEIVARGPARGRSALGGCRRCSCRRDTAHGEADARGLDALRHRVDDQRPVAEHRPPAVGGG